MVKKETVVLYPIYANHNDPRVICIIAHFLYHIIYAINH